MIQVEYECILRGENHQEHPGGPKYKDNICYWVVELGKILNGTSGHTDLKIAM